jgi:stage II sporulation protein AA (anti-sigma F factor antagonist)
MIDIEEKKNVVFDFSKVNFMDSSGIGVIMGRYRKVYYMGGKIYVIGINRIVDRIFAMSGLYRIVNKCESMAEIMEHVN